MTAPPTSVVIVGAGECGARAATELRRAGYTGRLVVVGDEPHAPYERPPLSKNALVADRMPEPVTTLAPATATDLGVELLLDTGVVELHAAQHEVELGDGRRLAYDRLLLATGARPRHLACPGGELASLLRTYSDAVALRGAIGPGTQVVVIGGGFIGLEVAAASRRRGSDVTVLEQAPHAMGRAVPADLADVIVKRHIAEGVDVRCGVTVERVERAGDWFSVTLAGGAYPLEADVVVAGVGAVPNVELAVRAGLDVADGIVVDAELRTSADGVYAAGDCCVAPSVLFDGRPIRLESWRNAHDQAVVVAANMLGGHARWDAVPWFWSDQYDLTLQIVGLPSFAATEVVRERPDGRAIRFGLDTDGRLVAASGVAPGTSIARDIRLAEMLIAARAQPDPGRLADPSVTLKSLLATPTRPEEPTWH